MYWQWAASVTTLLLLELVPFLISQLSFSLPHLPGFHSCMKHSVWPPLNENKTARLPTHEKNISESQMWYFIEKGTSSWTTSCYLKEGLSSLLKRWWHCLLHSRQAPCHPVLLQWGCKGWWNSSQGGVLLRGRSLSCWAPAPCILIFKEL